jgi:acetyltransferase-like isoleucine patch superfamily enzyme
METLEQQMQSFMELSLTQTLSKKCLARGEVYQPIFARCGIGLRMDYGTEIMKPRRIFLGDHVYIGRYVFIEDLELTVDDHNLIGPYVTFAPVAGSPVDKPVHIKEGSWIAAHAIIAPGVTIGKGSTVAAGSTVLEDVPDRVLVAGSPAKIIKYYDQE